MGPRFWFGLLQAALARFWRAGVMDLAAAVAFNTLLSLAPALLLLLDVASRLLGSERARAQFLSTVGTMAGPSAVAPTQAILDLLATTRSGSLGTLVSVAVMVSFASAVFLQLRSALNRIWEVGPVSFGRAVLERAISFAYALGALGTVLLVMLLGFAGALIAPLVASWLPEGSAFWSLLTSAAFALLLCFALALLFRHGPREPAPWRCVWSGAALTTLLFLVGNVVIGTLLGGNLLVSLYGPAGALVTALLWVYYAAQILLFGACFTRVYAESCRRSAEPVAGVE